MNIQRFTLACSGVPGEARDEPEDTRTLDDILHEAQEWRRVSSEGEIKGIDWYVYQCGSSTPFRAGEQVFRNGEWLSVDLPIP